MITRVRTGERRYRVLARLFKDPLVVLQIQWRATGDKFSYYGQSGKVDYTYWKDARVEDITQELVK